MRKTMLGISWILLLSALQCSSSEASNIFTPTQDEYRPELVATILQFIERVQQEKPFQTIVIFMETIEKEQLLMSELLIQLRRVSFVPLVLINDATSYEYRNEFNSEILLIRCLSPDSRDHELFKEFTPFPVITNFRVLLIFEDSRSTTEAVWKFGLYCRNMHAHQIVNMLAISSDFVTSKAYLRCSSLTGEGVDLKLYNESIELYEDRLRDLQGQEILTFEDMLEPRTMHEVDENGHRHLIGYVGQLLVEFVRKHNATLRSIRDTNDDQVIFYGVILNKTLAGELDVGATLIPVLPHIWHVMTYPYELGSFCYMIPMPAYMQIYKVYIRIIKPYIILILLPLAVVFSMLLTYYARGERWQFSVWDILLNDRSIRGILGQAFPMPYQPKLRLKYILMIICFTSLMVSTMYQAFLQTYLTHPPREPRLRSFEDIAASGKKIMIPLQEYELLKDYLELGEVDDDIFVLVQDFNEYNVFRETLNTDYIFPVSYQRWLVFNEQQKLFADKIFFYSTDMCIIRLAELSVPILENSRYRDALNRVILQLRDSGLQQLWMSWSFYDMVRIKKTSLQDLSKVEVKGGELNLEHLYFLWWLYSGGIGLSVIMFVWEKINWWWRWERQPKQTREAQDKKKRNRNRY